MPVVFFLFFFLAVCFVFCKHQTRMMKVVIQMIREIEIVYEEKPLIRSPEYKIGLSLCSVFISHTSFIQSN